MAHMEANSSAAEVPALGEVLELKYTNSADIEERANIMSAKYAIDDHLVSTDAKDFISKVTFICFFSVDAPAVTFPFLVQSHLCKLRVILRSRV